MGFFAEGDDTKALGRAVLNPLHDRETVDVANAQIGFAEFVVAPLIRVHLQLFPMHEDVGYNLIETVHGWCDVWIEQSKPPEAEVDAILDRIQNLEQSIETIMRTANTNPEVEINMENWRSDNLQLRRGKEGHAQHLGGE